MGSKFLSGGDGETDLSVLKNGSFEAYLGTLEVDSLTPNDLVRADGDKKLVSTLVEETDLNFSVLTNPNPGNLVSDGVEITAGNVLKTDTIEPTIGQDVVLTTTNPYKFKTDRVEVSEMWAKNAAVVFRSPVSLSGNPISSISNISVSQIFPTITSDVNIKSDLNLDSNNITNASTLTATTVNATNTSGTLMTGNLDLGENNIERVIQADVSLLNPYGGTNVNIGGNINMANATNKDISNVGVLSATSIDATSIFNSTAANAGRVLFQDDIEMKSNDILGVNNLNVNTIDAHGLSGDLTMNGNDIILAGNVQTASISTSGGSSVTVNNNLSMNTNNITAVRNITLQGNLGQSVEQTFFQSGTGTFKINKDVGTTILKNEGTETLTLAVDQLNTDKQVQLLNTGTMLVRDYDVDMNSNDINNIRSMAMTSTQYISRVEDMGTPVGNYYVIPDNTTWIILGQITLEYGIEFGANCSLRGINFSAQITFDETSRDCDIKATDNNFYLSQLTIVNGGGRFTGTPAGVLGLLNATNYDVASPAPFYGRNKRFKVTDCNILRPFKIGTVEGFGTLNITNNFFNGGGGLAGQATSYYTNEGLSVSDGLSLELNNNKMVLMLGAQQASTLKLLNMKARVSPLLGFNAVTITGNIFHPRSTETGVDFDTDSRTQLGNISGNVFIRTGGTSPLINYTDQTTYDNYNVDSVRNYNINANTGVVDSEPTLKSGFGTSNIITTSTYEELEFTDNNQVLPVDESSRFCIQLDLTGVTTAFVANERITDTASTNTALIMSVDAESGGNQSVYILDMSGSFNATPTTFTSATGSATGGTLRMRYKYLETDPRKLTLNMGITFTTDENKDEETTFAPGDGTSPDTQCEVPVNTRNDAVGGHLTLICVRRWTTGDVINFYAKTADATTEMNIIKSLVAIN